MEARSSWQRKRKIRPRTTSRPSSRNSKLFWVERTKPTDYCSRVKQLTTTVDKNIWVIKFMRRTLVEMCGDKKLEYPSNFDGRAGHRCWCMSAKQMGGYFGGCTCFNLAWSWVVDLKALALKATSPGINWIGVVAWRAKTAFLPSPLHWIERSYPLRPAKNVQLKFSIPKADVLSRHTNFPIFTSFTCNLLIVT